MELLADDERRHLLATLNQMETREPLSALARAIAVSTTANGSTPGTESPDVELLRTRLHHVHLPKLQSEGLVDYDDDRTVALTTAGESLASSCVEEYGLPLP